jgi:D-serine deaminase-like pyridoxal phosphate-dependent protein
MGNRGARTPACGVEILLDASSPRNIERRRGTQECVRHMGQQPNVKLSLRGPLGGEIEFDKLLNCGPLQIHPSIICKNHTMDATLDCYRVHNAQALSTPALLIYAEMIDTNISAALRMMNGDANRWRPHLKTAKLGYTMRRLVGRGVRNAKCATTLELVSALDAGMEDVVLAFPVMGANAARVREIAAAHPDRKISALVEGPDQLDEWRGSSVGVFVDLNSGMNRTGMAEERFDDIEVFVEQIYEAGLEFRGLHHYDGQIHNADTSAADEARKGYARLLSLIGFLEQSGCKVREVITSGTPAMPHALSFAGFSSADFVHRVSPGTIVYNDRSSLKELPNYGFVPAALVLTTVVSRPLANRVTCDAGHKAVSADAGVPTCEALGWPGLTGLKPSEEHLPIDVTGDPMPARGDMLYLLPTHVCPTVNNFDRAMIVREGKVESIEPVTARGREMFVT